MGHAGGAEFFFARSLFEKGKALESLRRFVTKRVAVNRSFLDERRINVHYPTQFVPGTFQKPPLVKKCSKNRHLF